MNFLQAIVFLLLIIIFFPSCDPGSIIKYEVINKTNNPIILKFELPYDNKAGTYPQVVNIPKEGNKIIKEVSGLGYIDYFEKEQDSIYIDELIIKQDNNRTHVNFKDKKYWKFKKIEDNEGVYQLFFDTTLFKINQSVPHNVPQK